MTDIDRTGRTVVGLFRDRRRAEDAIRDLQTSGFRDDQIGLASPEAEGAGVLVTVDGGPRTGEALAIMERHEVELVSGAG